jgi:hypothetical protein
VTIELRKLGLLPEAFVAVLDSIPTPRTKA